MHRLRHDGHYRDVQERVLYNNILGALELSGENFFYQNPLQSSQARYPWHGCPCCVGNIPRVLLGIKDVMYSADPGHGELYVNHFVDSEVEFPVMGGTPLRIRQETQYPWQGRVLITLHPGKPVDLALKLRIPDRTESELYTAQPDVNGRFAVKANGKAQTPPIVDGYIALGGLWKDGDQVELVLPLNVQRVHCDEKVQANRGRVAIQRGPIVYSIEDVDHREPVAGLLLPPEQAVSAEWDENLLGGVMVVKGGGLTMVPNYARLNRCGASQVWIAEDPAKFYHPPDKLPGFAGIVARTLDGVAVGDALSESKHALAGERTAMGCAFDHNWRHAGDGWFSYRMKVAPSGRQAVFCTYWGSDVGNRRFAILVDDKEIGRQVLESNKPGEFFGVEYPIPEELTRGKQQVTVKLQADQGATAGGIFDLRILRAEP
jgi:hypothetical protein